MERIGFDLKYGYIWSSQNESGSLVYLKNVGWIRKASSSVFADLGQA